MKATQLCSVSDCGKQAVKREWCNAHYRRWIRHGEPTAGQRPHDGGTCTVDQCPEVHYGRDMCKQHYLRWYRTGSTDERPPATTTCSVVGCERDRCARGYCKLHWRRWRNNGDPLVVKPTGSRPGPNHPCARGEAIGYSAWHRRLRRFELGPATLRRCAHCIQPAKEWAYDHSDPNEKRTPEGWAYSLDPMRYLPLCVKCHREFDRLFRRRPA